MRLLCLTYVLDSSMIVMIYSKGACVVIIVTCINYFVVGACFDSLHCHGAQLFV